MLFVRGNSASPRPALNFFHAWLLAMQSALPADPFNADNVRGERKTR